MQSSKSELPAERWNQMGEHLLIVGRYEQAIEFFDKAIEICNNSRAKGEEPSLDAEYKLFSAWHSQGIGFYELKRYHEAIRCFHKAIEIYQYTEQFIKNAIQSDSSFIMPWHIADVWYENGLSFSNLEDYEEACRCFDKAIELDNNFNDAWHNKGIAVGNLEKYDEALGCFNKVIDRDPNDADAWRNKGFILTKLEEHDDAIKCIDKAIEIKPYFAYAWNSKGYAILGYKEKKRNDGTMYLDGFANNRYEKAITCFDKAIETDPNFSPAFYNKGYVLICQKNYVEALEWINKAIDIDPKNAYARNYRGYAHLGLKLFDEAIRDFDKAIELDPKNNAEAWNYKGITILFSPKRNDKAVDCFDKAINIYKTEKQKQTNKSTATDLELANAYNNKGYALNSLEKYDKAIKCFDEALQVNNCFADAFNNRGISCGNLQRYKEAIDCFDKAIIILKSSENGEHDFESKRNLADILRKKGFAHGKRGQHNEAKECFDKAIDIYENLKPLGNTIDVDFVYALNSKGYYLLLYSLKEYDEEAIKCFDKASEIRPDFVYPLYNKGFLLSKLGKYDEAIKCLDKALKISPNFAHALYTKGYVLNSLRKYSEATTCFDKAIEIFYIGSEDADYLNLAYTYNNKGYALNSLEKYKEAIEFFDKAINIYKTEKQKQTNKSTATDLELANAYNNKGYALNSLEKYDKAIKCFDKSLSIYETTDCLDKHIKEIKTLGQDIGYLKRGQAKYMLDDCRSALDDFKKINEDNANLFGEKHNSIGLCYHKQQKIKKAEEEYIEATESNIKSIEAIAYYNLGVLYNNENRRGKAQKMFENSLNVDPNFSKAREAIKKFENPDQIEWYNWWFGHVKGKKALGVLLIASILTPIIMASFISYHIYFVSHHISGLTSFISHNISVLLTGIITMMGLSIAVLLLPSLTRIKVGSVVELETILVSHIDNNIKLEASVVMPSLLSVSMPTEIPLQSFRMPLQSMRMPTKYPLKSARMSLQSLQRL